MSSGCGERAAASARADDNELNWRSVAARLPCVARRFDEPIGETMIIRAVLITLTLAHVTAAPGRAEDALVAYRAMSPETALELASAALADCRQRGYQVAVAVVDRFGVTQAMLRDRFAGPHTPQTAAGKAWTAVSFRTNTSDLVAATQPGSPQAGLRSLPRVVVLGGGVMVEAGGSLVGDVGVSGGPSGEADDACAKAGVEAIRSKLDL